MNDSNGNSTLSELMRMVTEPIDKASPAPATVATDIVEENITPVLEEGDELVDLGDDDDIGDA